MTVTPYAAASKAYSKCKSRFADKNQAVAPYLAKQYLIIAGVQGEALEAATEHVHRLLDEWYCHKATNGNFFPQPLEEPEVTSALEVEPEVTSAFEPVEGVPDAENEGDILA